MPLHIDGEIVHRHVAPALATNDTELELQAIRQGYGRIFLTTGFRQPEAKGLYLETGYTPLFDISVDPEIYGKLGFEKELSVAQASLPRPPDAHAARSAA